MPLYRTYATAYGSPSSTAISGFKNIVPVSDMPAWIHHALERIRQAHPHVSTMNHVVVTRYIDDRDTISFHHDKWMDMAPGSDIVSLSIGGARTFGLQEDDKVTKRFEVCDGDLVILPYHLNQVAKHKVYPRRNGHVRYSIVARHIDTFIDPSHTTFFHRGSKEGVTVPGVDKDEPHSDQTFKGNRPS